MDEEKEKICPICKKILPLDQFVSATKQGKTKERFLQFCMDKCKDCDAKIKAK